MNFKKMVKYWIDNTLKSLPYTKTIMKYKTNGVPPGHYYSPISSIKEVFERQESIYLKRSKIPAIDLNKDYQF